MHDILKTGLTIVEYGVLLRVPLLTAAALIFLQWIAFHKAKDLLKGLFEVTPLSMFTVALTAGMAGDAIFRTASLTLNHAWERIPGLPQPLPWAANPVFVWGVSMAVCLPLVIRAVVFSCRQRQPPRAEWLAAILGFAMTALASWYGWRFLLPARWEFALTLVLYALVGIYGRLMLGRARTVPALAAALMPLILLCWIFSGLAWLLDPRHIPVLIPAALWGLITAQSRRADHYYELTKPSSDPRPAPADVLAHSPRPIVVAVNGGGIQAAAWSAQVLEGLHTSIPGFRRSLRMISSVSGGSVGSVFYLYSLAAPGAARNAASAAVESSLDEVAWGLAWPDFLKGLFPWVFGPLFRIGRGRAIEIAWRLNSTASGSPANALEKPLSDWNRQVGNGDLPAIIMNSTLVETGSRLLIGTTEMGSHLSNFAARMDATDFHTIDGTPHDVQVLTGARLSATFPYVTPASRAEARRAMQHLVDGGYYDTYGMATLVEWLDEALTGKPVEDVLVIQIRGSKIEAHPDPKVPASNRGWFYQAFAPLLALVNVRSSGQIAHNEIELHLLQQKWKAQGVRIHDVLFEFPSVSAPLSWHLTHSQIDEIRKNWISPLMQDPKNAVASFLAGHAPTGCKCPNCH